MYSFQINAKPKNYFMFYVIKDKNIKFIFPYLNVIKTFLCIFVAFLPYFTQTPLSYVSLKPNNEFYNRFNISVSFRPSHLDGIILYSSSRMNDFISITVENGRVNCFFIPYNHNIWIRNKWSYYIKTWKEICLI